jgi:opacity protein-like surface antigen
MRTRTFCTRVALGSLMICAATTGAAKDSGWYGGADFGVAEYPADANLRFGPLTLIGGEADDTDFAWSIRGGYRFSRYFAVEGGYVDFGEVIVSLASAPGTPAAVGAAHFKARGPLASAVGLLPVGNWEPFIKVSAFFQSVDLTLDGAASAVPFSYAASASGTKLLWGAGVGYNAGEHWRLKLEFSYIDGVGEEDRTAESNILSATVGIAYRF